MTLDVASGVLNAGIAISQGDYLGCIGDLAGAGLAAATGGLGGDAAAAHSQTTQGRPQKMQDRMVRTR